MISIFFCRLLVGAPLGQNLQPNTTRSGALWKCPLTSPLDDCIQVITDGKRSKHLEHIINIFICSTYRTEHTVNCLKQIFT